MDHSAPAAAAAPAVTAPQLTCEQVVDIIAQKDDVAVVDVRGEVSPRDLSWRSSAYDTQLLNLFCISCLAGVYGWAHKGRHSVGNGEVP
jgi:hypothetical protein